ncbi:uncharacterized protein LOC62_03G004295 [Vanrija pseudolonga]|uniref:F-box domain-containing protein n=1 Tax=Vanrija pseudolonga TaxID=143232 RepID=A0AAF0YBV0_9TREE|nr:hypothetical protein LOC62_03G004295 [Vanrija pseudolonga]
MPSKRRKTASKPKRATTKPKPELTALPPLPLEVLSHIVASLNPDTRTGRAALVDLLRVSACWEAAARTLYAKVRLNEDKLISVFLYGGVRRGNWDGDPVKGNLSKRTTRALGFIKRLHFVPPLSRDTLLLLLDEASRHKPRPLFPSVRYLHLVGSGVFSGLPPLSKDITLFDRPHVCVDGRSDTDWLVHHTRSFTNHASATRSIVGKLPASWESATIYDPQPFLFPGGACYQNTDQYYEWAKLLESKGPVPPLEMYLRPSAGTRLPAPEDVPIVLHVVKPEDNIPACLVCDRTWNTQFMR